MKMTPISMVIMAFFALGALGALGILSGVIPISRSTNDTVAGSVVMWGTLPSSGFQFAENAIKGTYKQVSFQYVQKSLQTFDSELSEAIASGRGPDLILISQEQLLRNRAKIQPQKVDQESLLAFKQSYVNGADIFLYEDSILAYPMGLESLIMFYNDRLLTSSGYAFPPRTWDEFQTYSSTETKVDDNRNIEVSLAALGTFDNIEYPLDILSSLILQTGNDIVTKENYLDSKDVNRTRYVSTVSNNATNQVIEFYTAFANPNKKVYSWNSSMIRDIDAFTQEKTSLWFGYPSDERRLRQKNPNLEYKLTELPQIAGSKDKTTYGRMYGVAAVRTSRNLRVAQLVQGALVQGSAQQIIVEDTRLQYPFRTPPKSSIKTERDALLSRIAVQTKGYAMPTFAYTYSRFKNLIESVASGAKDTDDASRTLENELNTYIKNNGL